MESTNLEMNDIFDIDGEDDNDREDYGAHVGLPDLDFDEDTIRPEGQPPGEGEEDEVLNNLKNLSKGAAKKRVQRPQPKLDPQRLQSDRGLPALLSLFSGTRFRGKGHEVEDLKLVMSKLEHWAHRLFPKMPFDDFIERLEKLGGKKEIQTCVKRIRLDMPVLNSDLVDDPDENKEISDENLVRELENSDDDNMKNAEMAYDEMIRKESERRSPGSKSQSFHPDCSAASQSEHPVATSTALLSPSASAMSHHTISSQETSERLPGVTTEQQERMQCNRMLAMQKRLQRLGQSTTSSSVVPSEGSADATDIIRASETSDLRSETRDGNSLFLENGSSDAAAVTASDNPSACEVIDDNAFSAAEISDGPGSEASNGNFAADESEVAAEELPPDGEDKEEIQAID